MFNTALKEQIKVLEERLSTQTNEFKSAITELVTCINLTNDRITYLSKIQKSYFEEIGKKILEQDGEVKVVNK